MSFISKHEIITNKLVQKIIDIDSLETEFESILERDKRGNSIMHHLCSKSCKSILETFIQRFKNSIELLDSQNSRGMSPLHVALISKSNENIDILLENNVDLLIANENRYSAIEIALHTDNVYFFEKLQQLIQENNSFYTDKLFYIKFAGNTGLNIAVEHNSKYVINFFLRNFQDLLFINNVYNDSNLAIAAKHNNLFCVEKFLSLGIDPNLKNWQGVTALSYALDNNNIEIALLLVSKGAEVNENVATKYGIVIMDKMIKIVLSKLVDKYLRFIRLTKEYQHEIEHNIIDLMTKCLLITKNSDVIRIQEKLKLMYKELEHAFEVLYSKDNYEHAKKSLVPILNKYLREIIQI